MTMRRQGCYVVAIAIIGGTGYALTGGSLHDAIGYGIARTVCEFFREPDIQLGFLWGGLTMGMLLCIPLILAGVALLAFVFTREPKAKDG